MMARCPEPYDGERFRPCDRPRGHEGLHGNLVVIYHRYWPPRPLAEFIGKPGSEVGDLLLSPMALDDLAASKVQHRLPRYVVTGDFTGEDGRKWLEYSYDGG